MIGFAGAAVIVAEGVMFRLAAHAPARAFEVPKEWAVSRRTAATCSVCRLSRGQALATKDVHFGCGSGSTA